MNLLQRVKMSESWAARYSYSLIILPFISVVIVFACVEIPLYRNVTMQKLYNNVYSLSYDSQTFKRVYEDKLPLIAKLYLNGSVYKFRRIASDENKYILIDSDKNQLLDTEKKRIYKVQIGEENLFQIVTRFVSK